MSWLAKTMRKGSRHIGAAAGGIAGGIAGYFAGAPVQGAALGASFGAGSIDEPRKQRKALHGQRVAEQARLAKNQKVRDANLMRLRELFGVGTTPGAQASSRTLNDAIQNYYRNLLSQNVQSANTQFAGASRVGRQNLARVGQLGSSLDTQTQTGNLADFLKLRQQAVVQAKGAADRLRSGLTTQRLGIEGQIMGGSVANPDFGAIASQRDALLREAQGNVVPSAIGNLFTTAGNTYFRGRVNEAEGNQGLQAFNFSNQSQRGSIS